ncbi:homocysteine S-methyltransferase family protein [Adlercreutzia sp. ZJ141]|uniref:homocysteine S-methyltransferase family protein n=1 Tax=Adlercreutzia sp. ZJ141 TaxID=2709406 RepID=UPI0013EC7539|nr:homocysteine S-methyltransferase family protein [Adlercreutzia sp. ZJ141]
MPDIQLRFHKDMLVLSAPIAPVLERQGFDPDQSLEFAGLVEPEAVRDALRLNKVAGAQCLVTNTESALPARLAHVGLEDRVQDVIDQGIATAVSLTPQHLLVHVGPSGLPLDPSSKASLNESRSQYARVARMMSAKAFDAVLLGGFADAVDLKCALMGMRQVLDCPVFASVDVRADGMLANGRHTLEDACAVMDEFGASVAGIRSELSIEGVLALVGRLRAATSLPAMVSLTVARNDPKQGQATAENPYFCPDTMIEVATRLRGGGVQFLRADGAATPAYTGALVAASEGFDVMRPDVQENE